MFNGLARQLDEMDGWRKSWDRQYILSLLTWSLPKIELADHDIMHYIAPLVQVLVKNIWAGHQREPSRKRGRFRNRKSCHQRIVSNLETLRRTRSTIISTCEIKSSVAIEPIRCPLLTIVEDIDAIIGEVEKFENRYNR